MALDYKALARAQYDPLTENTQYRQEKARLRRADAGAYAASVSAPGSIADQQDPNRFGTIASRNYPGLFGPAAGTSPTDLHAMHDPAYDVAGAQPQATQPGLRRNPGTATFNMNDLSDDEFLAGLGLNIPGLRRGGGV